MPVTQPPRLPRPSWDDLSSRSELSIARQRVLDRVERAHRPLRTAEVAEELGLHHNTVREHLDALVEAGFVRTTSQPTGRRGRPALLYSSTAPDPSEVLDGYLALLDAVAESLGSGEQAAAGARTIGRRWARTARQARASRASSGPAVSAPQQSSTSRSSRAARGGSPGTQQPEHPLAAIMPELAAMGFAPEPDGEELVLKACPLITGTRVPHLLVCVMHEAYLEEMYRAEAAPARSTGRCPAASHCPHLAVAPLLPEGCRIAMLQSSSQTEGEAG